ncbi:alpha-glucosidase [Spirochaetota bacterium]|nr:alpha-glucosidase [Spirochaetota bacterium]
MNTTTKIGHRTVNTTTNMTIKDQRRRNMDNWWQSAVIYQIYPRSYADTNSDGIGDLRGIIDKLGYIEDLGVDAIWLSPFFTSPMKDFGYDVSNYKAVDPMLGTMHDFNELIKQAHKRHLKVIIDQVYSHTSDRHPWFLASKLDKTNAKADWYVWADALADGSPPNNWQSVFGGNAWHWNPLRRQYYFHNFLVEQPDLNFHCPAVIAEILSVAKFWLELGVNGFRLDTVNFYFHDKNLRSNPPHKERISQPAATRTLPVTQTEVTSLINPYHFQQHLYDKTQPENIAFLKQLRKLMDSYGATMTIGEVGENNHGIEILHQYTKNTDRLHTCYSFDFLSSQFSPSFFKETLERFERMRQSDLAKNSTSHEAQSWACWAFSNHDVMRSSTRWYTQSLTNAKTSSTTTDGAVDDNFTKLLITLLGSLAGPICIYQGEELGLPEAEIEFSDLRDPFGINFYPQFKGRDGCRTPMPWLADQVNAGFSKSSRPWLAVAAEHYALAVDTQAANPHSTLSFTRRFLKFRKNQPLLTAGTIEITMATATVLGIVRNLTAERMYIYFNFTNEVTEITVPLTKIETERHVLFSHNCRVIEGDKEKYQVVLRAYGCIFLGIFK